MEKQNARRHYRQSSPVEPTRLIKIGELARNSGVSIEALRFYERQGLLGHAGRTAGGYRLYHADALERLEFIKQAQALGLTLAEIAEIIKEKEAGHSPCGHVREVVRKRLEEVDLRMREMRRYRRELAAALAEWDRVGDTKGHICGHIEGTRLKNRLPPGFRASRGNDRE